MINQREVAYALPWLHGKLKLNEEANLYYLLGDVRLGRYEQWYKIRKMQNKGKFRTIHEPLGFLKEVQQRINQYLLFRAVKHPASNGFAGGNCLKAVSVHRGYKSILMFDLRHAFSSTTHFQVFEALYSQGVQGFLEPYKLGFYCARMVADFCTVGKIRRFDRNEFGSVGGELPQGACTSPRLFELCMKPLDDRLWQFAEKYGLKYSRYADNLCFSSQEYQFPSQLRQVILSMTGKYFQVHKVRLVSEESMVRSLGLNLNCHIVKNTRDFKRAFRGALYHLEFCLNNNLDTTHAWAVVRGYAGFSVMETLPESLADKYRELVTRVCM